MNLARFRAMHLPPVNRTFVQIALQQLGQKSTVVAILSALILLVGWNVAPEKIEALGLLISIVNTVVLAMVQERTGPVTTVTTVSSPPEPPVTVVTTTDDSAPAP